MTFRNEPNARTLHQILSADGSPHRSAHTENLFVPGAFSNPTSDNRVEAFVSGREYFGDLIKELDKAASEILIAGWQVNWDALLAPGLRLYDVLRRAAARGVNIRVMPWDDAEPVQTYDDQTKAVLESINLEFKNSLGAGTVIVTMCPSFAQANSGYFSHHQKQVVIDRQVAYVGGVDIAYGRMDDATFTLRPNADGREAMNRYNPGIPPMKTYPLNSKFLADPDLLNGIRDRFRVPNPFSTEPLVESAAVLELAKIKAGAWQVRYGKAGAVGIAANQNRVSANTPDHRALDESCQPRMPWQDVQCKIQGPAVSNLLRNFVGRWNVVSQHKLRMPGSAEHFAKAGNAIIQVLRSAPAQHCARELAAISQTGGNGGQQDIHHAMVNLISKARRFIYIENQFFVSDFGAIGGPNKRLSPAAQFIKDGADGISDVALGIVRRAADGSVDDASLDRLPANRILPTLLTRLKEVILDDITRPKFHIYITLPVHPEGALCEATIAVQVYYTMQSLIYGSHSLFNGIRRLIKARRLKDQGDSNYHRILVTANLSEFDDISIEECYEYVTLLNLRNWDKLGQNYVTEQIYVHSKLIIVDDRFALMGSANINDRSLLGERDSELAVLVQDNETLRADINGEGSNQPVRFFAHDLRKRIWRKIFGISGNVRPAKSLVAAIESPGLPDSWRAIQKQAAENAAAYDSAFPFIPRNYDPSPERAELPARILPTWDPNILNASSDRGALASPMPYEVSFWRRLTQVEEPGTLAKIRGFITALPIRWTEGENIRINFPTPLIVRTTPIDAAEDKEHATEIASADIDNKIG